MVRRAHRRLPAHQLTPDPASRESNPNHVHPDRQEHQSHLPGLYRQERHVPFGSRDRLWHQDGRRHLARQRRLHPSRPAGVRHRAGGEREDRRGCIRDLRAAARRGGCDLRSHRCRNPADRLHHRRHSGARHGAGQTLAVGFEIAADRAELSGRDDRRANARSASCRRTSSSPAMSASSRVRAR